MPRIASLPQDDARNGWMLTAGSRQPKPKLKGRHKADLVVIGAGFAGLAAAHRYAELRPNDRVILIEAQQVGDGASGRNSGFVLGMRHQADVAVTTPLHVAERVRRISQAATRFLDDLVTRHQIRCDWARDGMYIAAVGPKGEANIERLAAELGALGEEGYRIIGREELARLLGTAHYRAALYTPNNILMQPGKLVRGLADALPGSVTLAELSPAIELEAGARIRVRTPEGEIDAARAILAVNAFAPQFGFFERQIFPVALHVTLTRPLTAGEWKAIGNVKPWGIIPAVHSSSPTVRFTADHRLMFRAGYSLSLDHRPDDAALRRNEPHHRKLLRDRFPGLGDIPFEHSWTGFVCASRNRAHGLGQPAPNVFTAVCENGVGATKSTVSGICAADMAAGERNPLADDLRSFGVPERVPPSPFFEIGFHAKRRWEAWRDRAEM